MDCKEESLRQALEDHGVSLPDEAINEIIYAIDMCDEYASYSTGGYDPQSERIHNLEKALKREREKDICGECKGAGRIVASGPYHSSDSSCHRCNGTGYIYFD